MWNMCDHWHTSHGPPFFVEDRGYFYPPRTGQPLIHPNHTANMIPRIEPYWGCPMPPVEYQWHYSCSITEMGVPPPMLILPYGGPPYYRSLLGLPWNPSQHRFDGYGCYGYGNNISNENNLTHHNNRFPSTSGFGAVEKPKKKIVIEKPKPEKTEEKVTHSMEKTDMTVSLGEPEIEKSRSDCGKELSNTSKTTDVSKLLEKKCSPRVKHNDLNKSKKTNGKDILNVDIKSKETCKDLVEEAFEKEINSKSSSSTPIEKPANQLIKTFKGQEMSSSDSPKKNSHSENEGDAGTNTAENLLCSDQVKKNLYKNITFSTPKLYRSSSSALARSSPKKRKSIFIESDKNDEDSELSSNESSTPCHSKSAHELTLFFTPEGTPNTSARPHFKRSLGDQYSYKGQSSFNERRSSSVYYTPDTSPSDYGSARKRFKPRWSDSSFTSSSYVASSDSDFQPDLIGYQLVGDSQFCRYGQQLLGLQRIPMQNSPGRIGICVSGQTISDLHTRVKDKTFPISEKIILMIGTNDFLRSVEVTTMCRELSYLINTLQETVTEIVLLTLPPIPKLERKEHRQHFIQLEKYNNYIRSLEDGEKLRVADISPLYSSPPPRQKCHMHLYEMFFNGPQRRPDMIHLNRNGLEVIRKYSLLLIRIKVSAKALNLQGEEQLDEEFNKEVRDYAVRIGINPDTEKHLLNIALDGLMSPLPEDWKPCLDERIDRIYYFNTKTHRAQWNHPLDDHFEDLVRKKRHEESISGGDDDSKTSIKEDLKSFEEASDMISSRMSAESHKSRLSSAHPLNKPQPLKDLPSDGRKVLNPIGLPPRPPPKRRPTSTSPKASERGSLSLRLSSSPSPTRIDIDSIGVPLGLPSPETKADKLTPATNRTPAIKLTGGGSAFLKSKQKQSPSPTEEPKPLADNRSFEIVREAESLDLPDEDDVFNKEMSESKLRHSASLGEPGFDKLTKSSKFASLHNSLLSLKQEMETHKKSVPPISGTPNALRGILREKPSPMNKLWDVDPKLLSSDEKEQLRFQELKEERKQNVRFADIDDKPIDFDFSKSDSEDESNTNDSTNDLDELILEHVYSDDDMKKEKDNKTKSDSNENKKLESPIKNVKAEENLFKRKEANKNILSRITELNADVERKDVPESNKIKSRKNDNNNKDESDNWLTDTQNTNQNELRIQKLRRAVYDNSKVPLDFENNTIDKHLTEVGFAKSLNKRGGAKVNEDKKTPSPIIHQIKDMLDKELYSPLPIADEQTRFSQTNELDLNKIGDELINDNSNEQLTEGFRKSKLMSLGDLQKVFGNIRDSLVTSTEQSDQSEGDADMERMQTSPLTELQSALEQNEEDLRQLRSDKLFDARFDDHKEQQRRIFQEKKKSLQHEFEENIKGIQKELQRQESMEKERFHEEVQLSVARYKEKIELEKTERESKIRSETEEFLKELEKVLMKDKELKAKKLQEELEAFMKEQEQRVIDARTKCEAEIKMMLETGARQLEKILEDMKQKEGEEIAQYSAESAKRIDEVKCKIEQEQAEQEQKHKQELAIVEADYERILLEKQAELEKLQEEKFTEVTSAKLKQEEAIAHIKEQHRQNLQQIQDQFVQEEEALRRKHSERVDALNSQLKASEREDITQINREFEKVRCEKRLLEEKYKSLKEKYVRLKNEVRLSMERKRQAKLNRQLQQQQQQRDPASTTEDTTERSTDHGKPPIARRKLTTALSSDDQSVENPLGTPKTIKRRPKPPASAATTTLSGTTAESTSIPPAKPKNVWNPSPQQRREGASSAEDNHTSVSEEIQMEQEDFGNEKWTQSALSPLENLRKQLEKLDDLEEKFPTSVHTDTYLRYPFSGPGASGELEFYRHRLHLERESVRRAKQALSEQRLNIEARQMQLRHKQHTETLNHLHQEERELTDMEVSLHRTRALLGEKIIRLRYLEQSIERATTAPSHRSQASSAATNTDSSGFSGSDLDTSNRDQYIGGRTDMMWNENVLMSLENINSEIREIWSTLAKQQFQGLGPVPVLNFESRGIGQGGVELRQASDIVERTRQLKEWLIRTQNDQATRMIAPVTL